MPLVNPGQEQSPSGRGSASPEGTTIRDQSFEELGAGIWHLDAYILRHLIVGGLILSDLVPVAEITDRSKSDSAARIVVLLQILVRFGRT